MKTLQNLIVGLLMVFGMSGELLAQEQPDIWYINGLGEGYDQGKKNGQKIVTQIIKKTGLPVKLLYNESESKYWDIIEGGKMILNWDNFYTRGTHDINPDYSYGQSDLSRNLKDMLNELGLTNDNYEPRKAVIIGHSEGALFVNRLAVKIGSVGGSDYIRPYSVASPDDFYTYSGDNSNNLNWYLNLMEDTVLNGKLSLVNSILNPNFTNYSIVKRIKKKLKIC